MLQSLPLSARSRSLGELPEPLRALLARRWWRVAAVLFAGGGLALRYVPLLDAVGWEFAAVFALPATFLGGLLGIAAVGESRRAGDDPDPFAVAGRAMVAASLPLIAPIVLSLLIAKGRLCAPGDSLAFWLLMPVAGAGFAACVGTAVGRVTRSPRAAGLFFALLVIASLGRSLFRLADGPALFAGNHFFGWFPGPIYEEALEVDPALLYLRLLSALLAVAVLLAAGLVPERPGDGSVRGAEPAPLVVPRRPLQRLAALVLAAAAFATASGYRRQFRLDRTRADVQADLGGRIETEHFVIVYARETDPARVVRIVEDHEFRFDRVTRFLGVAPSRKIVSYVFPSVAAKKRSIGAGGTQVANPFRGEIYIQDVVPNPVLEHELTHVVAAEFGLPVFGYSASVGLLEGIAVATSWHDHGRGTPHEQAAAMLADGLLPSPERFLGLGFWGDRQARAYVAAGSFVRFLAERYGIDRVRRAYPWGGVAAAFGRPLSALADEWRAHLATIAVPAARAAAAKERFTEPSIFERPCAREMAEVEEQGWTALHDGRYDDAAALFDRWRREDPRPEPERALLALRRRERRLADARAIAERLAARELPGSPAQARARITLADLAFEEGRFDDAARGYAEVFGEHLSTDLDRETAVKADAVAAAASRLEPAASMGRAAMALLLGSTPGEAARAELAAAVAACDEAVAERSGADDACRSPVGVYLLGRQAAQSGDFGAAERWLTIAADRLAAHASTALRAETQFLLAESLDRLDRSADAIALLRRVESWSDVTGDVRDRARDMAERLEWKRAKRLSPRLTNGLPEK